MLIVFRNGPIVNNETVSNDISVYQCLVLWVSFWYVQLHQKYLSVSNRFMLEGLVAL